MEYHLMNNWKEQQNIYEIEYKQQFGYFIEWTSTADSVFDYLFF